MADEQPTATSADAQTTTAPEVSTEAAPKISKTSGDDADAKAAESAPADDAPKLTEEDTALAGTQATTEVTAPDGEGKTEVANAPSDDAAATPASAKGKRKSTSGIPEHKGKKLNKKKSMANLNLDVQPGEYYWARLKGYPPWPSVVCDEEMLPEILLATRPVSAKRPDGSYREDFLEGGKNVKDRTYAVMFLSTNEFSWMVNTALTKLEPGDCSEDKTTAKMTKSLKDAYHIAEERHDLPFFHKMLKEWAEEQKKAEEERIQKEAEELEKATKKAEKKNEKASQTPAKEKKEKRKSIGKSKETVSGDDEMDVDGAESKPSKKRKKDAESEGEGPKKKATKAKAPAAKTNGDATKKPTKAKKVALKPDVKVEKEVLTEEQKLDRRQKAVLYLRHRLQKGFLTRDQTPKEEEMTAMAEHFGQLEEFHDLEAKIIRVTKIHKVLRAIIKLDSIPKEDEYKFKSRSKELLDIWDKTLDAHVDETKDATSENPMDAPATNGDTIEKAEETSKEPSAAPVEASDASKDATEEADGDLTMVDAKDATEVAEPESTDGPEGAEPETSGA
ncbi:hypothetical protein MBLNU459_g4349t1 [Dothideomycetes sp. NU459]